MKGPMAVKGCRWANLEKDGQGRSLRRFWNAGSDLSRQQMSLQWRPRLQRSIGRTKAGFSYREDPRQQHHKGAKWPGQERGGQTRRGRDHVGLGGALGARWRNLDFALRTVRQDHFEMGSDMKYAF